MSYQFPGNDSFPATVTLPDDSSVPDQANFSPGWESSLSRTMFTSNRLGGALRWSRGLETFGFTTTSNPTWDGGRGRWVIAASTAVKIAYDGFTWHTLGSPLTANGVATIGSPVGMIQVIESDGSMARLIPGAGEDWLSYTGPTWDTSGNQDGTWFTALGRFVAWESRPSNQMRIYTSSNTFPWSTWGSDQGAQFPSGFLNNGATQYKMFSAQSSTILAFFTSRPNISSYVRTTDAATYTTETMPITLSATQTVAGCAYDSQRSRFIIAIDDSATTSTRIFYSTAGATGTWTEITYSNPLGAFQGLTALNYKGTCVLVAQLWVFHSTFQVIVSYDGGVSWYLQPLDPPVGTGFVYSGDTCALYCDLPGASKKFAISNNTGPGALLNFDSR